MLPSPAATRTRLPCTGSVETPCTHWLRLEQEIMAVRAHAIAGGRIPQRRSQSLPSPIEHSRGILGQFLLDPARELKKRRKAK